MSLRQSNFILFLFALSLFWLSYSLAYYLVAKPSLEPQGHQVIAVIDGDTIDLLINGETTRIRLEGIDAPEKNQAFGPDAKSHLAGLVFEKRVRLQETGKDFFGRTLGVIFLGDRDINRQMVLDGYAWHYLKYSDDPKLASAEQQARELQRGLWSQPTPESPWKWRRR